MNLDEVIKEAYEEEVSQIELPINKYEEMLDYIENDKHLLGVKYNLLNKIAKFINMIKLKDFIEVTAFILVLVIVPIVVKHFNIQNNEAQAPGIFLNKISAFIQNPELQIPRVQHHPMIPVYTDINIINQKTPYSIDYPKFLPDGMKQDSISLSISEDGERNAIHEIQINYQGSNKSYLRLTQSEDYGTSHSISGDDYKKININGTEAWLSEKNGLAITIWSNGKYYNAIGENIDKENFIKIVKSLDIKKNNEDDFVETSLYYTDMNTIKKIVPYKIEYSKYIPKGYEIDQSRLQVVKSKLGEFYSFETKYRFEFKEIYVTQMNESAKPEELLKKFDKIKVGNKEIWTSPIENLPGGTQVVFWKNGVFIDIFSETVDKYELIEMAKSFDDSYKIEIPEGSINIKDEKIDNIEAMKEKGTVVQVMEDNQFNSINADVYNISNLDRFMDDFEKGIPNKVRLIQYVKKNESIWIYRLMDMESDGKTIKNTIYDLYTNKKYFIPNQTRSYGAITKNFSGASDKYIDYLLIKGESNYNQQLNFLDCSKDNIKN